MECEDKMLDSYEQYKHCSNLLNETMATTADESTFQRQCLLNLIEVRNLPKVMSNPAIKVSLETEDNAGRLFSQDVGQTKS